VLKPNCNKEWGTLIGSLFFNVCCLTTAHVKKQIIIIRRLRLAFKSKYNIEDYVGQTFGRLEVKEEVFVVKEGETSRTKYFLCKCSCGNKKLVSPYELISRQGTKSCGCLQSETTSKSKRKTQEQFIRESKERYPGRFNYDKVVYTTNKTNVVLECVLHGEFSVSPNNHLKGHGGCPECKRLIIGEKNTKDTSHFISKATEVFGERYDYSSTVYRHSKTPVAVGCRDHGDFLIVPTDHLKGGGCPECYKQRRFIRQAEFIERCISTHGNRYDLSNLNFTSLEDIVTPVCDKHGVFEVIARNFARGANCRCCIAEDSSFGFRADKPASLYILELSGCSIGEIVGYGITSDVKRRLYQHTHNLKDHAIKITRECYFYFEQGWQALDTESHLRRILEPSINLKEVDGFKRESSTLPFKDVVLLVDKLLKEKDAFKNGNVRFITSC